LVEREQEQEEEKAVVSGPHTINDTIETEIEASQQQVSIDRQYEFEQQSLREASQVISLR